MVPLVAMSGTRVLFIGDSITDGAWGNSGGGAKPSSQRALWDMNHIYGHGYMYLCAAHYQGRYPSQDYEFFNRGISGNTLSDLEKRWKSDAIDIKPDVLSILIGTNDVDVLLKQGSNSFDYVEWERRYRRLLDEALDAHPNLKLVLCAPFVANTGKMRETSNYGVREEMIKECAEVVKKIAKDYNAIFVPYHQMFATLIAKTPKAKNTYWIWDGIHPTAAGHQQMADLWIKVAGKKTLKR